MKINIEPVELNRARINTESDTKDKSVLFFIEEFNPLQSIYLFYVYLPHRLLTILRHVWFAI